MTRRELQELVGFDVGPKMKMVVGPDGTVYGCCEDGSWEPYLDESLDAEERREAS